jgi:hypothetical protein
LNLLRLSTKKARDFYIKLLYLLAPWLLFIVAYYKLTPEDTGPLFNTMAKTSCDMEN